MHFRTGPIYRTLFTAVVCASITAHAQWATLDWQRCIGGGYAEASGMTAYPGGGFVITGQAGVGGDVVAYGAGGAFLVARVDADGTLLWAKVYAGSRGLSVCVTESGDIWAAGSTGPSPEVTGFHEGTDSWALDLWVTKLNADGNLLWERAFGGSGDDQGRGIVAMPDGGCTVTGYTRSSDGDLVGVAGPVDSLGNDDAYVLRLAANGDLLWQRRMGGNGVDDGEGVCIGDDNHIYVGGTSSSQSGNMIGNHGGQDAFVAKLTYQGNVVWARCYGGSSFDYGLDLCAVDGGVAFTGFTGSNDGDVSWSSAVEDFWVVRLALDGNIAWSRTAAEIYWWTFPSASTGYAIARTPDDGVAVATFCDWQGGDQNFAPWYLSASGDAAFAGFYGGPGSEICYGIAVDMIDGGIGVCGKTAGANGGDVSGSHGLDAWVIKLANSIGVEENGVANGSAVWYDGIEGLLAVTGSVEVSGVRLWDAQGRLVFEAALPAGGGQVQLPAMNTGIYVAESVGKNGRMAVRTISVGSGW